MSASQQFTNTTFTNRVDHEARPNSASNAHSETAVCGACGARYEDRQWTAAVDGRDNAESQPAKGPVTIVCPACKQTKNDLPRGFLRVSGWFLTEYREYVEQQLKNEAELAQRDNPLARIMWWGTADGSSLLATTTEHLARRLGNVLEKAFNGKTRYEFSHENKLVRICWHRD